MIYEVNIFREKYIESQHLVNVSNLDSEKGFEDNMNKTTGS